MTDFDKVIDYDEMFAKLSKQGVSLSTEQMEQIRQIGHTNAKRWGNAGIGSSFGAAATNFVYTIFSFIQNLFKGFDFKNIGDSFSNITGATGTQSEAARMHEFGMHMYTDLTVRHIVTPEIATMITGEKLVTGLDASTPELIDGSIPAQLHNKAGVDLTVQTSLNRKGRYH